MTNDPDQRVEIKVSWRTRDWIAERVRSGEYQDADAVIAMLITLAETPAEPVQRDPADKDPEWAAPGPTVYQTLMDEAATVTLLGAELSETLDDHVAPVGRSDVRIRVDDALRRAYTMGIAEGYSQAARRFDTSRSQEDA